MGIRVYPVRIEECITEDPNVEKCAVLGIKDDEKAYRTIAFIISRTGINSCVNLEEQINKRCRVKLPESHVPDEYVFVENFPMTRAGKIDYRALEKIALERN